MSYAIYLAGKISHNDWRFPIVPQLTSNLFLPLRWEILPNAIFGVFDYTGPYFYDRRYTDRHGVCFDELPEYHHSDDDYKAHFFVSESCVDALEKSNLIFAWIESIDCYGTLFELGYAHGQGKNVIISGPLIENIYREEHESELWLALMRCHTIPPLSTAQATLKSYLEDYGAFLLAHPFNSPLEEAFASQWIERGFQSHHPLVPQYPLFDGKYRLDFALPDYHLAIELDGFTYHRTQQHLTRDHRRQRIIEGAGWDVIRFSSEEIRTDVQQCVRETWQRIATLRKVPKT